MTFSRWCGVADSDLFCHRKLTKTVVRIRPNPFFECLSESRGARRKGILIIMIDLIDPDKSIRRRLQVVFLGVMPE